MTRSLFAFVTFAALAGAQTPDAERLRQEVLERVAARAKTVQEITDSLFSFSELGYQEFESTRYLVGILEQAGFDVTQGVAGMPTAFVIDRQGVIQARPVGINAEKTAAFKAKAIELLERAN